MYIVVYMGNKLVLEADDEVWRKFSAYCKFNNIKVGKAISDMMNEKLNKEIMTSNNIFDKIKRIRG